MIQLSDKKPMRYGTTLASELTVYLFIFGKMEDSSPCPLTSLVVTALSICGDIQLNPGPRSSPKSMFPCGCCQSNVSIRQAKCSNVCDIWFHWGMSEFTYSRFNSVHDCPFYRYNSYLPHIANTVMRMCCPHPIAFEWCSIRQCFQPIAIITVLCSK